MAPEQLLFLLVLLALPLLERLIRAVRERATRPPTERASTSAAERAAPPPQPPLPPRETTTGSEGPRSQLPLPSSTPPVLPQTVRHRDAGPQRPFAGERARVRSARPLGAVTPARARDSAQPMRRSTRAGAIVAGGDLRHAIVLMAIFGPCRALQPTDASQRV